jgi:D-3-phosphoglycerate dehydrogenase / 2-oxoglutarate reductase
MTDVLVTENIVGPAMESLKESFAVAFDGQLWQHPAPLAHAIAEVRALVVRNQTQVTAELLAQARRLEIIARAGVGLDNIDVEAASRAGIVVSFTPSQNSISVAELTLGLMLALARKLPAADRHVKAAGWARQQFMGSELYGKTLGIVGFGRIGFFTARRAAVFGMDLLAYDPYLDPDAPTVADVRPRSVGLDELLAAADFVTCHLPSNPQTQGMFSYDRFCLMKPGAFFINVARGEVVDEPGLLRALKEGRIAGAALDVRSQEPPQCGELERMDNVVLMPHIGAFTHEAQDRVVSCVCRDVAAVLAGGRAVNYANFALPQRHRDLGI